MSSGEQPTVASEPASTAPLRPADGRPVSAAVLSVGSELLLGDLTDTNATWLSRRLRELGVPVVHHLAVRDDVDELVGALEWLGERVEVVVVGGGLGPTEDDLTREALAVATGVELEERDELADALARRFASFERPMAATNLRQARIPEGSRAIPAVGTAPGFALTVPAVRPGTTATRVYALPGVPWELREMFHSDVAPEVQAIAGPGATVTRVVHVVGRGESDVATLVEPLVAGHDQVTLSFLARSSEVQVRLTLDGADAQAARRAAQPLVDEVVAALGSAVVGLDEETLEDVVLRLLGASSTTVATAESATAGDVAARLGRVPGASAGLVGGAVVYATAAKHDVLGVDQQLLREHGAVSEPVTRALAAAVRERFGSDWGLATTGVAGPQEQDGQPVGSVFWALAHPDGTLEAHHGRLSGDRAQVIARLGSAALDLLRRRLSER